MEGVTGAAPCCPIAVVAVADTATRALTKSRRRKVVIALLLVKHIESLGKLRQAWQSAAINVSSKYVIWVTVQCRNAARLKSLRASASNCKLHRIEQRNRRDEKIKRVCSLKQLAR